FHLLDTLAMHVVVGERVLLGGGGVGGPRTEGVRGTGAEGAHHRRGGTGTALAHLRRLLPDSRLRRDRRFIPRRVALEHQSASEFRRRGGLRRPGNVVVLVVRLPAGWGVGRVSAFEPPLTDSHAPKPPPQARSKSQHSKP